MQHHQYADDTQLEHTRAFERMKECVREVKIWLCDNGLVLNENKSEAIIMQSPNVDRELRTFIHVKRAKRFDPVG